MIFDVKWLPSLASRNTVAVGLAALSICSVSSADTAVSGQLQEIVVTAEKRVSTVQQVPLSVTAITGDQLDHRGMATLEDVATQTPGISMKQFSPGETEYEMRGLPSSGGASATVGLYLNEIPMSAPAQSFQGKPLIDPSLFDLDRVEVLRGPQGTLYGAGSEGGTIRLITALPAFDRFRAASQTTLSNTANGGFNWAQSGMVNLPLDDHSLALRLVGTAAYNSGWIDRVVLNPFPIGAAGTCGWLECTRGDVANAPVASRETKTNWERLRGGRAELKYQPTDALTVDAFFMYQGIQSGAFPQVDASGVSIDQLVHYQPNNLGTPFSDSFRIWGLNVTYDLGFAQLTSASSTWNHDSWFVADDSELGQILIGTYFGLPTPETYTQWVEDYTEQTSQELRLASHNDGPFQWLVGGFFSRFESIASATAGNPVLANLSTGGPAANPTGIGFDQRDPYLIKQYAAFTEETYAFTPTLKATIGARYFRYSTNLRADISGLFAPSGNATPTLSSTSVSSSGATPKVDLSYQPSRDLTIYAQVSKGFRPGGVNYPPPAGLCPGQNLTYAPESIWNYEVGEKARFANGRVVLNADLYYIRLHNAQQSLTLPCTYVFSTNVGDGESYGPELELSAQLTDELSVSIAGTYTTAHIVKIDPALAGSTIGATELLVPGIPLLNVPQYTVSEAIDYGLKLADGIKLSGRVSATSTGPTYDVNYFVERLPPFTIVDARLGLSRGPWEGVLFAHNLTNKIAKLTINTLTYYAPEPAIDFPAVTTPRTVGLQVNYRY